MRLRGGPRRVLCLFSALGVAAILVTVVLLLAIERRFIARNRAEDRAAHIENARQRCDILKGVLLARIQRIVNRHPDAVSLLEVAAEVKAELATFSGLVETAQGVHTIVVDEKLQTIAALDPKTDADLSKCARHVLEEEERVYTLPREAEAAGAMPDQLCYTSPIRRGGTLLGGIVIRKDLDPIGDPFGALGRTMTWTVILSQALLFVLLAAIAILAHRALAEAERRRAEDERLAALGNLAAGIAHEIRNPLNTISLTCRYIERLIGQCAQAQPLRAEVNRNFEIISGELGRLTRTLDDFLLLAKPASLDLGACDVEALVDEALALFASEFEEARIRLVRHRGGPIPVAADADRLRQVFANIIKNGIQAMADGGTLAVTTEQADGMARVRFADNGPGIGPAHLHRIFEPYFSTKRSGLGLGLSLSLKIVRAHGGTIEVANQPGGGAVFGVSLPLPPRGTGAANHAR